MKRGLLKQTILFLVLSSHGVAQSWIPLDKASKISFNIKNFGVTVEGTLSGIGGTIQFDPDHIEKCNFNISVSSSSIDTGIELRDRHLRKAEYLDVVAYPIISFRSLDVKPGSHPAKWIARGLLTIKKTTREVSVPFTIKNNDSNYSFEGSFKINRRDFGVGGSSLSMADTFTINLHVVVEKNQDL